MKNAVFVATAILSLSSALPAQVEIDNVIDLTGADGVRMIHYLELPVNGTDAVNKDYVDAAVSAGGGGSCVPTEISAESATAYSYAGAAYYCSNLTEGGHSDWRLPEAEEIQLFAGIPGASTNYLWTRTHSSTDYVANQNFVSVRLDNGAWRDGEAQLMRIELTAQTPSTNSTTPWTSVATINPTVAGNWIKITDISLRTMRGSVRLKYNYPNGTSSYSFPYSNNATSLTSVMTWSNSNEPIVVSSIGIEAYSNGASANTSEANIAGFETNPFQKDGNTLYARCVR